MRSKCLIKDNFGHCSAGVENPGLDNHVHLQLFALAYNQGNFLRRMALPKAVKHWSLTTTREKLVKIEAKVVPYARYVVAAVLAGFTDDTISESRASASSRNE